VFLDLGKHAFACRGGNLNLTKREICAGNNSQSVNVADCLSRVRNGQTIFLSPFGDRQNFSVMVGHALGCPPTLCQRAVTLGHEDMGPGDRRGLGAALQDSPRGRGAGFVRVHHSTVNLDLLQSRAGFKAPDDLANDRRFRTPSVRDIHDTRLARPQRPWNVKRAGQRTLAQIGREISQAVITLWLSSREACRCLTSGGLSLFPASDFLSSCISRRSRRLRAAIGRAISEALPSQLRFCWFPFPVHHRPYLRLMQAHNKASPVDRV
jgi:hypothetical protein